MLLAGIGAVIVLGAIAMVMIYEQTPVPTAAMAATGYSQSVVYSSNGTVIGRFGTTNREMLTYTQLQQSPALINAVLAAEDRNFFNEGGVSPTGIMRAAYEDIRGSNGSLQGGSTITQEFVRQYYSGIGTQQTLSRKFKEIFVAMKVAKEKSKQWILTNYLNTIYMGDGAYGVEAAAETYYGKKVPQLDVAQAAVIAAIIQQPSTYPLPQYRPELINRWHYVLSGMVQMGKLTQQQANTMKFPVPSDYVPQTVGSDVWDPYILDMVYNELVDVYHFSQAQIYTGGYTIRTSIDNAKMAELYQAVRDNEAQINASGVPFNPTYMHAGAVLENPADGSIQALYPGPGYPGRKYNGTGKAITKSYCKKIACEVNMAVYNREQVGSSFKPYILSAAVKQGMNVQTSTLDGYNNLYIPMDSEPNTYSATAIPAGQTGWYLVHNDDAGENGPYSPQMAMAVSINTAYADLWHKVAGTGGSSVVQMAQAFGVNTDAAGITAGPDPMHDQAGIALGQASLTVGEQATMLATIDDNGIYHDAHVITSITQNNAPPTPIKITSYPVFNQIQSHAQRRRGHAGAVGDVRGHRVLRHGTDRRAEQRPGDHRQDRHHQHRPVGVLHRRHPETGAGRRAVHQRTGQGHRDAQQPRRQFPGRLRRYLAGRDLAHLRPGRVRPARRRAVHHAGLHRQRVEPGAARPAQGREEAQEGEQRPERPERPERLFVRPAGPGRRQPQPLPHLQL